MNHDRLPRSTWISLGTLVLAFVTVAPLWSQRITGLPLPSQKAVVAQTIGITEIKVVYHRPLVKDRVIWDELVPYNLVWRAGANENTTISFSHPVKIEGHDLAAGTYGLHMIPAAEAWTVIFNKNAKLWGSFGYNEAQDALRVKVKPRPAPFQEALTYKIGDITQTGATVSLHWEKLDVPWKVDVDTPALVHTKIEEQLEKHASSWQIWNSAAEYYLEHNTHHDQALEWIHQALSIEENYDTLRTKSLLLIQSGETEEGSKLLAKTLELANQAQVNMIGYHFVLQKDFDRALEIFGLNVERAPDWWVVHASLGEALAAHGMTEKAAASFAKAMESAPEPEKSRLATRVANLEGEEAGSKVQSFWF